MNDIALSPEDLDDLITTVSALFRRTADAVTLLRRVGYPAGRVPNFDTDHLAAWDRVFTDLAAGVIETPYRRLIAAALRIFSYLEYVDWFNHRRLFEAFRDIPPAELATAHLRHYAALAEVDHSTP